MRLKLLIFLVIASFPISCQLSIDEVEVVEEREEVSTYIISDITIKISDINQQPLNNIIVFIGENELFTNAEGIAKCIACKVLSEGDRILVEATNYFRGYRYFLPTLANNYFEVEMIPKRLSSSFESSFGDSINLNGNVSIYIPENAFYLENDSAYNGQVKIFAYWISPEKEISNQIAYGNLVGMTKARDERSLSTFGTIVIDAIGSNNEVLKLKSDASIDLFFPIPATLLFGAPISMPVWQLDYQENVWQENTVASLINSSYKTAVNQLGVWSCSWAFDAIETQGVFWNAIDNTVMENAEITVYTTTDEWKSTSTFSNINGKFRMNFPANTEVNITIKDTEQDMVYSKMLGIFSEDINLDTIIIN